ncbi:putative triple functional domain protein-like [Scophthalmus maximus]|uniref:Putative triple functional domain protein-like n=1 Tax=Scophthalmus maximus TaxID=52904 RepID=A0A2U9AZ26_SCOMX|nr:putative triple functional domain protein-like [Scophthalmus maximus]
MSAGEGLDEAAKDAADIAAFFKSDSDPIVGGSVPIVQAGRSQRLNTNVGSVPHTLNPLSVPGHDESP